MSLTEEAKEARRQYYKDYYQRNKEKRKKYNEKRWLEAAKKSTNEAEENK